MTRKMQSIEELYGKNDGRDENIDFFLSCLQERQKKNLGYQSRETINTTKLLKEKFICTFLTKQTEVDIVEAERRLQTYLKTPIKDVAANFIKEK